MSEFLKPDNLNVVWAMALAMATLIFLKWAVGNLPLFSRVV